MQEEITKQVDIIEQALRNLVEITGEHHISCFVLDNFFYLQSATLDEEPKLQIHRWEEKYYE